MKPTDYAPRPAPFDLYLKGQNLTGIEVGCDVGAHAEALLTYCPVGKLYLIDIWEREYYLGYCEGRLTKFRSKIKLVHATSTKAVDMLHDVKADFIYIDITHDYQSVKDSLKFWWPSLKVGGVLGYRNYADSNKELQQAVDEFIVSNQIRFEKETGEIILFK